MEKKKKIQTPIVYIVTFSFLREKFRWDEHQANIQVKWEYFKQI